jgi:hypothetical protein
MLNKLLGDSVVFRDPWHVGQEQRKTAAEQLASCCFFGRGTAGGRGFPPRTGIRWLIIRCKKQQEQPGARSRLSAGGIGLLSALPAATAIVVGSGGGWLSQRLLAWDVSSAGARRLRRRLRRRRRRCAAADAVFADRRLEDRDDDDRRRAAVGHLRDRPRRRQRDSAGGAARRAAGDRTAVSTSAGLLASS